MNTPIIVPRSVRIFSLVNIAVGGVFFIIYGLSLLACIQNIQSITEFTKVDFMYVVSYVAPFFMFCFGVCMYFGSKVYKAFLILYTIGAASCIIEVFYGLLVTRTPLCGSWWSLLWLLVVVGWFFLVYNKDFRIIAKESGAMVSRKAVVITALVVLVGIWVFDQSLRFCGQCTVRPVTFSEVSNTNYDGSVSGYSWIQKLNSVNSISAYKNITDSYKQKMFDGTDINCDDEDNCSIGDGVYDLYRFDIDNDGNKELVIVSYKDTNALLFEIFDEKNEQWVPRDIKTVLAGSLLLDVSKVYPVSFIKNTDGANRVILFGPFRILELHGNTVTDITTPETMFELAMSNFVGTVASLSIIDEILGKDKNNFYAMILAISVLNNDIENSNSMLSRPNDSIEEKITKLSVYNNKLQELYDAGVITIQNDVMQYYQSRGNYEYVSLDWARAKEYWNKCVDDAYPIHYFCEIGLIKIAIAEHDFTVADTHLKNLEKKIKGNVYVEDEYYTYSSDEVTGLRGYLQSVQNGDVTRRYDKNVCPQQSASNIEDKIRLYAASHGVTKQEFRFADYICNVQVLNVEKDKYVALVSISTFDREELLYSSQYMWIMVFTVSENGSIQKLTETKNPFENYYEMQNTRIIPTIYHDADNNSYIGIDFIEKNQELISGWSDVTNARLYTVDYKNSSLTELLRTTTTIECTDVYYENEGNGVECPSLWAALRFTKTKHNGKYDIEKYFTPEVPEGKPASMVYKWNGEWYESTDDDIFDFIYEYREDPDDYDGD